MAEYTGAGRRPGSCYTALHRLGIAHLRLSIPQWWEDLGLLLGIIASHPVQRP